MVMIASTIPEEDRVGSEMSILFLKYFDQFFYENLHNIVIWISLQKAKVYFAKIIESKNHWDSRRNAWALLGVLLSFGPPCPLKIVGGPHPCLIYIYHSESFLDIVKELLWAHLPQDTIHVAVRSDRRMNDLSICHVEILFQNGSHHLLLDAVEASLFKVLTNLLGADNYDFVDS
jgi:hypothetical protein